VKLAGIVGPTAFVAAWVVGGLRRGDGYSPVQDAISRLAEVGAPTQPLMTAGFVTFGVAVPAFAISARDELGPAATVALVAAGITTLGVAATPLGGDVDTLHAVFAGTGYVAMAAAPLLAARTRTTTIVSAIAAVALAATTLDAANGLLQRVGLGVVDAWIVATALRQRPRRLKWSGAP
jgi:hypothetical membrane protein